MVSSGCCEFIFALKRRSVNTHKFINFLANYWDTSQKWILLPACPHFRFNYSRNPFISK